MWPTSVWCGAVALIVVRLPRAPPRVRWGAGLLVAAVGLAVVHAALGTTDAPPWLTHAVLSWSLAMHVLLMRRAATTAWGARPGGIRHCPCLRVVSLASRGLALSLAMAPLWWPRCDVRGPWCAAVFLGNFLFIRPTRAALAHAAPCVVARLWCADPSDALALGMVGYAAVLLVDGFQRR